MKLPRPVRRKWSPNAAAGGVTLGVVLQHRHKPAVERLAELLRSGEIGTLVGASAIIRLWRPQSYYDDPGRGTRARDGGGVLITQAIHTLDVLLSLAGQPASVMSLAGTTPVHRMESEDMVCAAVRWRNGALGVIEATTAAYPGAAERIELTGTRGTATLLGTALEVRRHDGHTANPRSGRFVGRHRCRSNGLPARLSPQRLAGFPGCNPARRRATGQRRRSVARAPADRCVARQRRKGRRCSFQSRRHRTRVGIMPHAAEAHHRHSQSRPLSRRTHAARASSASRR